MVELLAKYGADIDKKIYVGLHALIIDVTSTEPISSAAEEVSGSSRVRVCRWSAW